MNPFHISLPAPNRPSTAKDPLHHLSILTKNHLVSGQKLAKTLQGSYSYLLSSWIAFVSEPGNFVDMGDGEEGPDPSPLVNVTTVMLPPVSGFSLADDLVWPRKEM